MTIITTMIPERDTSDLHRIWNARYVERTGTPVIRRDTRDAVPQLRLPYHAGNRVWLRGDRKTNVKTEPDWNGTTKVWTICKSWFDDTVDRALDRFGRVYIVQPYRVQEVCAPACQNAKGHDCSCSCGGASHGGGDSHGWFEVSDTFMVRYGPEHLAVRLLTKTH